MLGEQVVNLALADAMLSGARAAIGQGALDQPFEEGLHLPPLLGIGWIDQRQDMEIAVAYMADDGGEQSEPVDVLAGGDDAGGQRRDRHADIGR